MAFALRKPSAEKKSPLAGWLGKKKPVDEVDVIPEVDVTAGLNRALRGSQAQPEHKKSSEQEQLNPVRDALGAIETALYAIDRVRDILEQATDVVVSVKDVEDIGGRSMLAETYDELRLSIDGALSKIDPRAAVLIGKQQRHIDVRLGAKTRYSVSPMRLDIGPEGLDLPPPADAFETDDEVDAVLDKLDKALARADRAAGSYCRDAQYLIARMNAVADANA